MSLRVVARVAGRPDRVPQLHALLVSLLAPTRREKGCIRYELLQNAADPTDFTFVEEWADQAAIDAHMATPHVQHVLANVGDLLTAPPDIRTYRAVAP